MGTSLAEFRYRMSKAIPPPDRTIVFLDGDLESSLEKVRSAYADPDAAPVWRIYAHNGEQAGPNNPTLAQAENGVREWAKWRGLR